VSAVPTLALPPAPGNDEPAAADIIDPNVPTVVFGTTVLANDSISSTTLPAPVDDVDGPDVFYSLTANSTETYRFMLFPWQRAPLRSSDRRFILYVQDDEGVFITGAQAPGNARPFFVDVPLFAGSTYRIGVDYDAATHDNFPFTLVVDTIPATTPDDCGTAETLSTDLPTAAVNSIAGGSADYLFQQGDGTCAVSGTSPTNAPGIDHVYVFTPQVSGEYAFELGVNGFDGVLYINTACPPVFPGGCVGASNHSTSGSSGGKHEFIAASLDAGTDYYVYVDTGSNTQTSGDYALVVDTAFAYEVNELEPNDSFLNATLPETPLNGGQLVGPADEDWWAVPGTTGDRVYAWVNNGGSSNSTLDADLGFYAADGSTLIEFDDEDADGADAPIEDLRFIYSTSSPVIAGAQLTSDATHFLRVTKQSATGTIHRYRMHVGVEPGSRDALAECEPNDSLASADFTGKHYYAGVIDRDDDVDFYAFDVLEGDRVFVALDGDPERDSDGFTAPGSDPLAFHAQLMIYDQEGDLLIDDISDSNSIQGGPDYPAQGGFFIARSTGTHYVSVEAQSATGFGPDETYGLAIFVNASAPDLAEDVDPELTLTPDFLANLIDVTATDDNPGDSGICDVTLVDATNIELTGLAFSPGDATVNFSVTLINDSQSGFGKLRVADCEGNTACTIAKIDVNAPICQGFNFSERLRTAPPIPIHVPDNQPGGPGILSTINIDSPGPVTDVNVTVTIETIRPPDIDCFLISPQGTSVELFTDRGTSLEFDIIEATFDDVAEEILPILSAESPYTGTWLPEDPAGLAQLNGEDALGSWSLQVIDDAGGGSGASGGARLVEWRLDLEAGFPGPDTFAGTVTDTQGFDCGIATIEISGATNATLNVPPGFTPGDQIVDYTVTLDEPSLDGSATITITDLAENTCTSNVVLTGLPDTSDPANDGSNRTQRTYRAEVQADIPGGNTEGFVSIIDVSESGLVGEVEVDLTIDTKDIGRIATTLSHDSELAVLLNRVGTDERGSVGLTKDVIDITLDDDAPQEDDAHEEPASSAVEFFGPHQPDGRGDFIGDGITTDPRDNMLFALSGTDSSGQWALFTGDFLLQGAGSAESVFRRWAMTVKNPCGAEHFAGVVEDLPPGSGICSITLAGGSSNLLVDATFTPGDGQVAYEVQLIDDSLPGSGTLDITDCTGNITSTPIALNASSGDDNLPMASGSVILATAQFEGTATDDQPGDTGIVAVALAPYATNLELISVDPSPPDAADSVTFVVGLVDPLQNGRGYVRVTDTCGLSGYGLVEIDTLQPVCTGTVSNTKRYVSEALALPIPDNNVSGVTSTVIVPDTDEIADVDVTLNITHPFDDDIIVNLIASPTVIPLFSEIGFTGNDFIDTTLDDEADMPIPDSSSEAPFTGSYQPEGGPALFALDAMPADGPYTLRVADDTNFNVGTFESWALTIESETFPPRFNGRAEDGEALGSGICSFELLPGADNLTLSVDEFTSGDKIVRYSVEVDCELNNGLGSGTVRVSDCAGNTCDVPVALACDACPESDAPLADGDGPCAVDGDCANTAVCRNNECYTPKNRYLSIRPGNDGSMTALRVTHVDSGRQWWVGAPGESEIADLLDDLGPELYRDWSDTPVVEVTGCGVATNEAYEIQAISQDCDPADESAYSSVLSLPTATVWGDVVGDFVMGVWLPPNDTANFVDILATVQGFQFEPNAAPDAWLDIAPENPNDVVNFEDVLQVVLGFQAQPYSYSDPADCPATGF
ncbi:MAG: proprotein convertase P-domain-containing protein, partial [Planctomycetota bacterium]|jgi:subtilisin-like proprotein convertase family protein